MSKRGSFVFGMVVSIVLVLVAFIAAYPFIQKSISTTTGLGEGIFDKTSEKNVDGYELFIKDLKACVSSVKSDCWCNIDYGKLYSSLKDNKMIFSSDGSKIVFNKVSLIDDFSTEDSIVNFKGNMFSYWMKFIRAIVDDPFRRGAPPGRINFEPTSTEYIANAKYGNPEQIFVTGLTSIPDNSIFNPIDVKNTLYSNGLLETNVPGVERRLSYLGNDMFIYKSSFYEYYYLDEDFYFLRDLKSNDGVYYTLSITKSANKKTMDLSNHDFNVVNYHKTILGPNNLFFVSSDFEKPEYNGYYPLNSNGVYLNGINGKKIAREDNVCNEASI